MEGNGLPRIMNLEDIARYLKVHPSTIYRLLKKGQLRSFKVGRDHKFSLDNVNRWIQQREKIQSELVVAKNGQDSQVDSGGGSEKRKGVGIGKGQPLRTATGD